MFPARSKITAIVVMGAISALATYAEAATIT